MASVTRAAVVTLALLATLTAHAQPTPAPRWRVVVVRDLEADPGNGTTIGTSRTTITITPRSVVTVHDDHERGQRATHTRHAGPALSAALQAEVVALIAALPTDGACYALSDSVPDEGSDDTSLTVFDGTTTRTICIQNGRASPTAPHALARLIEIAMSAS